MAAWAWAALSSVKGRSCTAAVPVGTAPVAAWVAALVLAGVAEALPAWVGAAGRVPVGAGLIVGAAVSTAVGGALVGAPTTSVAVSSGPGILAKLFSALQARLAHTSRLRGSHK